MGVIVADPEPAWADRFAELAAVFGALDGVLRVEHVGSTAVLGLAAKPILDIDLVTRDLARVGEALQALGYTPRGELGVPGRFAWRAADEGVPRVTPPRTWMRHNLYVCPEGSRELTRHLAFRDHLRSHPEDRAAYAALKRSLAARGLDIDAYCEAKTELICSILARCAPELCDEARRNNISA